MSLENELPRPLENEDYWSYLKRCYDEVQAWPAWKKGEIGVNTPTRHPPHRWPHREENRAHAIYQNLIEEASQEFESKNITLTDKIWAYVRHQASIEGRSLDEMITSMVNWYSLRPKIEDVREYESGCVGDDFDEQC